ncbi:MAG TPA: hypothetical protein VHU82_13135 [Vicinamibacterales bacterium]|jgi:hypothetical protein|nr:hypothetical protein [Vicinamibacterales bacterium]
MPRLRADDLHWLERARLKNGSPVSLIDLSLRGAFFEVASRLRPGDLTELELVGDDRRAITVGRIIRAEIAAVRTDGIVYRGACMFDGPLPWTRRLAPAPMVGREPVIHRDVSFRPWAGCSEARLVFRHGPRLSGFTRGFQGSQGTIDLWPSCTAGAGEKQVVPLALLRSLVIIRDFDEAGAPLTLDPHDAETRQQVEVVFSNNDRVSGGITGFQKGDLGFWVLPVNQQEGIRVFAVSSSVSEIRVFSAPDEAVPVAALRIAT